jgi:hypothetical protein
MKPIVIALAALVAVLAGAGTATAAPVLGCQIITIDGKLAVAVTNLGYNPVAASSTFVIQLKPKVPSLPGQTFVQQRPSGQLELHHGDASYFYPPQLAIYRSCTAALQIPRHVITQPR